MFNVEKPDPADLPAPRQLFRSTVIAAIAAVTLLFTVVMPAEYGIDPTGIGRTLGLTQMGEIKNELRRELEQDHGSSAVPAGQPSVFGSILNLIAPSAHAQSEKQWDKEVSFVLAPGETYELKLTMDAGDRAGYLMIVEGGRINFDLHGHGNGKSVTYEKGRGSTGSEGEFAAAFAGGHGWFWRNRDSKDVTVTVKLTGSYSDLKHGR